MKKIILSILFLSVAHANCWLDCSDNKRNHDLDISNMRRYLLTPSILDKSLVYFVERKENQKYCGITTEESNIQYMHSVKIKEDKEHLFVVYTKQEVDNFKEIAKKHNIKKMSEEELLKVSLDLGNKVMPNLTMMLGLKKSLDFGLFSLGSEVSDDKKCYSTNLQIGQDIYAVTQCYYDYITKPNEKTIKKELAKELVYGDSTCNSLEDYLNVVGTNGL